MEEIKTRFFDYYVHEEYKLECEVTFKMDKVSKDFEVYKLEAYNNEGLDILECFRDLYVRRFGTSDVITVFDDIVFTAEEHENLN
tara:strand:- start:116 stop:370 length:255 start_codon:yes stop_codon:yes gene_type:complete